MVSVTSLVAILLERMQLVDTINVLVVKVVSRSGHFTKLKGSFGQIGFC